MPDHKHQPPLTARVPRTVWALGFVSMLMDVSSEIVHSLLPLFLVSALGVSALAVGLIEGLAEATASVTKLFSGALSDWAGKRKPLVLVGYGLSALTKPVFALAPSVGWVVGARVTDRVGKGIRGAPRDALVADVTPRALLGASYGLRQSLDTVGAFAGPLLAMVIMGVTHNAFRTTFWLAGIPAALAVALIVFGVQESDGRQAGRATAPLLSLAEVRRLGAAYWGSVTVAVLMTLARFSEAFLLLRAENVGMAAALVPAVLLVMNLVYAGAAYPVGRLSDRLGRRVLLGAGFAALAVADVVLALAMNVWVVLFGAALWGLHMGMTQGLLATMVADSVAPSLRGTAFGLFHLVSGVALFVASLLAGWLWSALGPSATFGAGALCTALALVSLTRIKSLRPSH
ncbi:MAG: Permease of the major facilitator superfamily [candidate division NC10 bacterium]|nr:Permease of the major facilitator superfamily [candidate division NC10 bacterium]